LKDRVLQEMSDARNKAEDNVREQDELIAATRLASKEKDQAMAELEA